MVIEPDPENALCFPFLFFPSPDILFRKLYCSDTKIRRNENVQAQKLTHTHLCYIFRRYHNQPRETF